MPVQERVGAVIYAKDIARVSAFYANVAGFKVSRSEEDHVVLDSDSLQLFVVAIQARVASSIEIESPPKRRTETPIKLVLPVHNISVARAAAAKYGGELNSEDRAWSFQGQRVCDGHDPEGNVLQVRERAL